MKEIRSKPTYTLLDGVNQHAAHPDTFAMPDPEIVELLSPGHLVKLAFQDAVPEGCKPGDFGGERMWVSVVVNGGVDGGEWTGALANDPVVIEDLEFGDEVTFTWRNVIDYHVPELEGL